MNRREFMAAGSLSTAVAKGGLKAGEFAEVGSEAASYQPWIEISRAALEENVKTISTRAGKRPILAVLKNNAYGHGLSETASCLEPLSEVYGSAVFHFSEALQLRNSGNRKPILLFGPLSDDQLREAVQMNVTPAVDRDLSRALIDLRSEVGHPVEIQLYLDTGLGRMGVPYHQALPLVQKLHETKAVRFTGVLTALVEDEEFDREQLKRLSDLRDQARREGIDLGSLHAMSSAGVFHHPDHAMLDMVRPGIAVYGCYPTDASERERPLVLKPCLSLKARVAYLKQLRTGDSLQYHRPYVAKQPVWIATVAIGYTDGWPREAAGKCQVAIKGKLYPVVAAVTSNHTLIEIGPEPEVSVGDEVLFWGQSGRTVIEAHSVEKQTGHSVYGLLAGLRPGLTRRIV